MNPGFLPLLLIGTAIYAVVYIFVRRKQEFGFIAKLAAAAIAGALWYCVAYAVLADVNAVTIILGVLLSVVLAFADGVLCPIVQYIGRMFLDYFRTGR
ncbi:MAG: hypothetical protein IJE07_11090 [Clostridia bacterium]|nr:hypothetical protein [Clostridia bacterium]